MAEPSEASIAGLIRGALDDLRELMREELALAKAEVRQEVARITAAGMRLGAAGVMFWFATMFVLVAVALAISESFTLPGWVGFLVVGVLLGVAGAVMAFAGRRALRGSQPMQRTVETLKENFR